MTGVYTAFLFAQAKARDLWQNPLLPPHLAVQSVLAGAAALVPVAMVMEPDSSSRRSRGRSRSAPPCTCS
jgi:formate-dependent nitrite reductase membrane component NrfD